MNDNDAKKELENNHVEVVEGVSSAYQTPVKPAAITNDEKIRQQKIINAKKSQAAFEKLVQEEKNNEIKRRQEQERYIKEIEIKNQQKLKQEELRKQKEEQEDRKSLEKLKNIKQKQNSSSLWQKLNANIEFKKYSKQERLRLEAKRIALQSEFSEASKNNDETSVRLSKAIIFDYLAKDPAGVIKSGKIEAYSRVDVYSFLLAEGYEIYDISVSKSNKDIVLFPHVIKMNKLIFYLSQLSAYLKSGIALADAVKIIMNQTKTTSEKQIWWAVYYNLSMGDNLSTALAKRGGTFPALLINMIKTAEMTGNLSETLDDMVDYYTEADRTTRDMKTALIYPTFILIFALCVVIYILTSVVSQFKSMFDQLGAEIPTITRITMSLSDFLTKNLLTIAITIVIVNLIIIILYRNVKAVRMALQKLSMHMPIFGNIIIYKEITIFTKTFANLLNHNVFITDSISVLNNITENEVYKKLIHNTSKNLAKGEPISLAFKDQWAFPPIAYQMLLTGEKTGRLGPMMEKVSEYYSEQHRTLINRMKSLLEPIMIIILAVIVGIILLSVVVPMFSLYKDMG